ncbi:tautomerase family protein [Streptomyces sp. NPDC059396]|uniref:tautomerase family protein n=1 Tax=Streptomyces sp. NPDC059396 TaxID=3346819 RepID=UPI00369E0EBB
MPIYNVVTALNVVSDEQKAGLAADITRIHSEITGAPTSFVHVTFNELSGTNIYSDSVPSQPLLITGITRAGRADREKAELAKAVSSAAAHVTGVPEKRILVVITDHPARFAVERGRILPEPGVEDDWLDEQAKP